MNYRKNDELIVFQFVNQEVRRALNNPFARSWNPTLVSHTGLSQQ